jgi:carbon starvation protein
VGRGRSIYGRYARSIRNKAETKVAAGALSADRAAVAPQLIFNQRLDAALTVLFTAILWIVILDMGRVCVRRVRGLPLRSSSEAPYRQSQLPGAALAGH